MLIFSLKFYRMYKCISVKDYVPVPGESFTLPSQTVPDQVMSLKDMLLRHSRGQVVPEFGLHYDEDGFPDPRTMDLTELEEMRQDVSDWIAKRRQEAIEKKGNSTSVPASDPVEPRKYDSMYNEYRKNGGKMSYLELEAHMDSLPQVSETPKSDDDAK